MCDQGVICFGRVDDELVAQRKVVVQGAHDGPPRVVQLLEQGLDVGDQLIAQGYVLKQTYDREGCATLC